MKLLFVSLISLLLIPTYLQAQEVTDRKFWTVNTLLVGSTVYDVESTYFALDRCGNNCREGNPFMRPFVKAGKPWLYAVQGSVDAGIIYSSYKMKKNNNKLWWLLPIAITTTHSIAGTHNIRIALRF